jgi:ribosome-binding factor A
MQPRRLQRVRELLVRNLGELIRREMPISEAGLVSVSDVELAGDLQSAVVYVSILGDAVQQKKGLARLREERKRFQALLGQAVVLKYTPHLEFELDDSIRRGNRVIEILNELERSSAKHETPP